jgi:hypothetical protein
MKSTVVAICLALVTGVVIGRATIASTADMAPRSFETASVTPSFAAAAEASREFGYGTSGATDWTRNFFWQ